MREHGLLSPRRVRKGEGVSYGRTITTDAPDVMWGTDGMRVMTVEEGMCWIFAAADHFNCEVVGHHVCKRGDRFAALQPVSQALGFAERFGLVVEHQWVTREEGRLARRLKNAQLKIDASIEEIWAGPRNEYRLKC